MSLSQTCQSASLFLSQTCQPSLSLSQTCQSASLFLSQTCQPSLSLSQTHLSTKLVPQSNLSVSQTYCFSLSKPVPQTNLSVKPSLSICQTCHSVKNSCSAKVVSYQSQHLSQTFLSAMQSNLLASQTCCLSKHLSAKLAFQPNLFIKSSLI